MRQKRIRRALVQVIREHPEGLTAHQIIEKLDPKKQKKVSNAKHISVLLRGIKGVEKKGNENLRSTNEDGFSVTSSYSVNVYIYNEDEGAEI